METDLQWTVWAAFWDLHRARNYHEGFPLGLPVTEITEWFAIQQVLDTESRREMYQLLSALDAHFVVEEGKRLKIAMDAARKRK